MEEIKIDKKLILEKFKNLNKELNLEVLKCEIYFLQKMDFSKMFEIIFYYQLYYIISLIFFSIKEKKSFKTKIEKVISNHLDALKKENDNNIILIIKII